MAGHGASSPLGGSVSATKEAVVVDLWRAYVQMAAGLGELTAARARDVARAVVNRAQANGSIPGLPPGAPAVASSVAAIAEDLLAGARANRGMLVDLVRGEVERAVAGMGLVTPTDLVKLERRVSALERGLVTTASTPTQRAARTSPTKPPAKPPAKTPTKSTAKTTTTKAAARAATKATPRTPTPPTPSPRAAGTRSPRAGRG